MREKLSIDSIRLQKSDYLERTSFLSCWGLRMQRVHLVLRMRRTTKVDTALDTTIFEASSGKRQMMERVYETRRYQTATDATSTSLTPLMTTG